MYSNWNKSVLQQLFPDILHWFILDLAKKSNIILLVPNISSLHLLWNVVFLSKVMLLPSVLFLRASMFNTLHFNIHTFSCSRFYYFLKHNHFISFVLFLINKRFSVNCFTQQYHWIWFTVAPFIELLTLVVNSGITSLDLVDCFYCRWCMCEGLGIHLICCSLILTCEHNVYVVLCSL